MGDEFDIDYSLLPPKLQLQLWVLALDADTGKVNLAYRRGSFRTALGYNYGGNIQASLGVRRFTGQVGVNPSNGDVDLGVVFRGFKFSAKASFQNQSVGAGLSFGAPLLPFPHELTSTFNAAGNSFNNIAGNLSAAPDNPLAFYNLHSDDISAITSAVAAGRQIHKHGQSQQRFGGAIRLNYSGQFGLTIYGGAQVRF